MTELDYDRTSRHILAATLISSTIPAGATILDVGGGESLLDRYLEGYSVLPVDISSGGGVRVVASGAAIPFRDDSFPAVVGLDLLEHVPAELRASVIAEMSRVAQQLLLLAGPFAGQAVEAAERQLRGVALALWDQNHSWLQEHLEMGLPDLYETEAQLRAHDWNVAVSGSNPVPLWVELQETNFYAARFGATDEFREMHRRLTDEFLDAGDGEAPSYRHFLAATPSRVAPPSIDARTSTDGAKYLAMIHKQRARLLVDAEEELLGDWHAGSRRGQDRLRAAREEIAVAESGWREAVESERAAREAVAVAESGWREAVESEGAAQQALHNVREDLKSWDRTLTGLEDRLVGDVQSWLIEVSGPPVIADPSLPDFAADYSSYVAAESARSARPRSPVTDSVRFSILMPVFNPPARFLESSIRSVRNQSYENWELVIADVSDAPHVAPICERFTALDSRIKVTSGENLGIAGNTNRAASAATGDWFMLLDHDDELAPRALEGFAEAIAANPDSAFGYTDEDKIDEVGHRSDPFFKPDWSPDLLHTINYITHLSGTRRDLWERIGGLRTEYDFAQDYDLALRATAENGGGFHVPEVMYHWRTHATSTASDVRLKPRAHRASRRALQDFADHYSPGSWVEFGTGPTTHHFRYSLRPEKVSIIVPFRDQPHLTDRCLSSVARTLGDLDVELLLVDNGSVEARTHDSIAGWLQTYPWVRLVTYDEPFNFQKLNNYAVTKASGDLLLFLNNDTEALHRGWIEAMAEHAQRAQVGAVGARLFYDDGRIQHAGVAVGIGGYADHPWAGLDPTAWTPTGPSYWTRNFLAVSAACLMIGQDRFEKVGGFDERFIVGGGDVALGLALREQGYWNVMTPYARLIHHESVTRGRAVPESDLRVSRQVYAPYLDHRDPFYNPNLSLEGTGCDIRLDEKVS